MGIDWALITWDRMKEEGRGKSRVSFEKPTFVVLSIFQVEFNAPKYIQNISIFFLMNRMPSVDAGTIGREHVWGLFFPLVLKT